MICFAVIGVHGICSGQDEQRVCAHRSGELCSGKILIDDSCHGLAALVCHERGNATAAAGNHNIFARKQAENGIALHDLHGGG